MSDGAVMLMTVIFWAVFIGAGFMFGIFKWYGSSSSGSSDLSCGMTQAQIDQLDRENRRIQAQEDNAASEPPKFDSWQGVDPDLLFQDRKPAAYTIAPRTSRQRLPAPSRAVFDDPDIVDGEVTDIWPQLKG